MKTEVAGSCKRVVFMCKTTQRPTAEGSDSKTKTDNPVCLVTQCPPEISYELGLNPGLDHEKLVCNRIKL
jgi:hypothetical protein